MTSIRVRLPIRAILALFGVVALLAVGEALVGAGPLSPHKAFAATVGQACSPNGSKGIDGVTGLVMTCVGGVWKAGG